MSSSLVQPPLDLILASQHADGGWGYGHSSAWTEPTVYALLALRTAPQSPDLAGRIDRAIRWLLEARREDGSWAPNPGVDRGTWVTALTLLLAPVLRSRLDLEPSIRWLLRQSGRESGLVYRLRAWMLGHDLEMDLAHDGWPWFPEAAAWVTPTALTILALEMAGDANTPEVRDRLEAGRKFLLARRCDDGGWNHGASRALGYEAPSYPETTGLALLALHSVSREQIKASIEAAQRHLQHCRSAEGVGWLELGLLAHGVTVPEQDEKRIRCYTVTDAALRLLAQAARRGQHAFLAIPEAGESA